MARRRLPPEPFELSISKLNAKGAGLAVKDDQNLAVRGALPDEKVVAKYLFGRRFRGQAEVLEVLEASPNRVDAPCPTFGTCSACTLQHLEASAQLSFKAELLREALAGQGVTPDRELAPLAASPWHYRRKARMSVRFVKGKGRVLVGFREFDGRFVADMQSCHTLYPLVADALPALSLLLGEMDGADRIPQIEASCGDESGALVFRHLDPLSEADLDRLQAFEAEHALKVYLQPKGPDTVVPLNPGPAGLSYELPEHNLVYQFEPLDFVQVNQPLNRLMIDQALNLLDPGEEDRVLDLFCGLGNFTLPLARRCKEVIGLESAPNLIKRATENALANDLSNVRYQEADLYEESIGKTWPEGKFDLILLDPPRSGADPVLHQIAASGARRILYVSCNPATLALDARRLTTEFSYDLKVAGAMDMFPQTTHIEGMALFELRGQ